MTQTLESKFQEINERLTALLAERDRLREINREMTKILKVYLAGEVTTHRGDCPKHEQGQCSCLPGHIRAIIAKAQREEK